MKKLRIVYGAVGIVYVEGANCGRFTSRTTLPPDPVAVVVVVGIKIFTEVVVVTVLVSEVGMTTTGVEVVITSVVGEVVTELVVVERVTELVVGELATLVLVVGGMTTTFGVVETTS